APIPAAPPAAAPDAAAAPPAAAPPAAAPPPSAAENVVVVIAAALVPIDAPRDAPRPAPMEAMPVAAVVPDRPRPNEVSASEPIFWPRHCAALPKVEFSPPLSAL